MSMMPNHLSEKSIATDIIIKKASIRATACIRTKRAAGSLPKVLIWSKLQEDKWKPPNFGGFHYRLYNSQFICSMHVFVFLIYANIEDLKLLCNNLRQELVFFYYITKMINVLTTEMYSCIITIDNKCCVTIVAIIYKEIMYAAES